MCRIGAIKSRTAFAPSKLLYLMAPQQEGHDNSGFAMVLQDLEGLFKKYKDIPLLSFACTIEGLAIIDAYMDSCGWSIVNEWVPETHPRDGLDIHALPIYAFRNYEYPPEYYGADPKDLEELLLDTRLKLRELLDESNTGFVYSFWPDVLTLKEIGSPNDIATYFGLWDDSVDLWAHIAMAQCRQNTNHAIVRYAAHPFFLQGYTLCANGENTFYTLNKEYQQSLHRGYIGFESDSQNFLYTLHYILRQLNWPLNYFKHVITPLPYEQLVARPNGKALLAIRQSLANLEINGPNTIIGMLPDGSLLTCCDAKKLRPVVVGYDDDTVVIASEVCALNAVIPLRDSSKDIYPNEREIVLVTPELEVKRWKQ